MKRGRDLRPPALTALTAAAAVIAVAGVPSSAAAEGTELVLSLGAGVYVPTQDNGFAVYDPALPMPGGAVDTLRPGVDLELALSAWWGLIGAQIGVGYLTASWEQTHVDLVPVTALLRARLPLASLAPYLEGGGGICFTSATTPTWTFQGTSASLTMSSFAASALVWVAGLGADLDLGSFRLGASVRYVWVDQSALSVSSSVPLRYGSNTMRFDLDGLTATASLGYRFLL